MKKVLVIGSAMVDIVYHVPQLPSSAQGIIASAGSTCLGGCAVNNANVIRQMGVPLELMAPVGKGLFAAFVQSELEKRSLPVFKPRGDKDNANCVCLVEPDGERSMISCKGIESEFQPAWFDHIDIPSLACAIVAGYELIEPCAEHIVSFLERMRAALPSADIFYAPGPMVCQIPQSILKRICALAPIWHLNEKEALEFSAAPDIESAASRILALGASAAIVTCGKDGVYLFDAQGGRLHVPTTPIKPLDTIGAGDSHLGAIAAGRASGWDWKTILTRANRVSGAVCMNFGGQLDDAAFAALKLDSLHA